jgi:hypothetical protein
MGKCGRAGQSLEVVEFMRQIFLRNLSPFSDVTCSAFGPRICITQPTRGRERHAKMNNWLAQVTSRKTEKIIETIPD